MIVRKNLLFKIFPHRGRGIPPPTPSLHSHYAPSHFQRCSKAYDKVQIKQISVSVQISVDTSKYLVSMNKMI